jgi:hypothetical protein
LYAYAAWKIAPYKNNKNYNKQYFAHFFHYIVIDIKAMAKDVEVHPMDLIP